MFLSISVLALVTRVIRPNLFTITVLLILEPVAFVVSAICVVVLAIAMGFIIFPFAVVHVTIGMDEPSTTVGLVSSPVAFIERAIDPDLGASAILAAHLVPLTLVLSPVVELHHFAGNSLHTIVSRCGLPVEVLQLRSDLHDELAGLLDLNLRLCVSWCLERSFSLETVLCLHNTTSDDATHKSLHRKDGELFLSLWVIV